MSFTAAELEEIRVADEEIDREFAHEQTDKRQSYYFANRDRLLDYNKQYYQSHREYYRKYQREYQLRRYYQNREKICAERRKKYREKKKG